MYLPFCHDLQRTVCRFHTLLSWMYLPFCHDVQQNTNKLLNTNGKVLPECTECFNLGLRALHGSNCPIERILSMINYFTISLLFAIFLAALWSACMSLFAYCLHLGFWQKKDVPSRSPLSPHQEQVWLV